MSSGDIALSIRNVSKRYMIAPLAARAPQGVPSLVKRLQAAARSPKKEPFWALRDVSFDVRQGEVVGIIGKNGAGKSTLLKILSRITEPTAGTIEVYGRIGSLLEVGTGFHPELTGRENVFLNGAILGMSRAEINGHFDEIVEFSGVEQFLDTPVKRYSSGMYVRLAFAVAAHLNSEILIIDEVLAVGDAEFQRKCLGKIRDVSGSGRTVLFVSHNLTVVSAICGRAVFMSNGRIAYEGLANDVVSHYHSMNLQDRDKLPLYAVARTGLGNAVFEELRIVGGRPGSNDGSIIREGSLVTVEVVIACYASVVQATVAVIIYDSSGFRLVDINSAIKRRHVSMSPGERLTVRFTLKDLRLRAGSYPVGLWIGRHGIEDYDNVEFAGTFEVVEEPGGGRQAELYPGPYTCAFELDIEHCTEMEARAMEKQLV